MGANQVMGFNNSNTAPGAGLVRGGDVTGAFAIPKDMADALNCQLSVTPSGKEAHPERLNQNRRKLIDSQADDLEEGFQRSRLGQTSLNVILRIKIAKAIAAQFGVEALPA